MAVLNLVAPARPPVFPTDRCVLAFARPPSRPAGFSMRDRIELERWSRAASPRVGRVRLEAAEPTDPPEMGEFLLMYAQGKVWASWAAAARADGAIELWSMRDGVTLGVHPTLAAALAAVPAV